MPENAPDRGRATLERKLPVVDEILGSFDSALGRDARAYGNHVYRVVNLCFATGDHDAEAREKIEIAGAFHDLGIWTEGTLDYLRPSELAAAKYLVARGRETWIPEITEMIEMHHRVRSCAESRSPLVEAFRRADVADFSLGLFRMGLPRELIAALKAEFPNSGFHKRLVQLGVKWTARHPLNPLPMFRA